MYKVATAHTGSTAHCRRRPCSPRERESSFTISEAEEGRREVQGGNKEKCRGGEFRGGGAVSSLPSLPCLSSYFAPKGARKGGTMLLMMIAFQEGEEERKEGTER